MNKPTLMMCVLLSALALSGCGVKGDKGNKGEAARAAQAGPPGHQGLAGAPGKNGRDGVSPPLPFRIVRAAVDNGISKPALCGTDEIMISATCIVKAGEAAQSPRTMGESGAS